MTATETPPGEVENPAATSATETASQRSLTSRLGLDRFSALYLLGAFFVFFTLTENNFLQWNGSIELVLTEKVIVCMLALAFLVPLTTETFDLSIGANMALSLVIVNKFAQQTDLPDGFGALLAIGACMLIGVVNGYVVVKLGVNSFIATLGMSQVIAALVRRIHDGGQIVGELSDSYVAFGKSDVFSFNWPGSGSEISLPWYFVYGVAITIAVWYVLEHTPLGRHMFATGGNREAARLSGVRTENLTWGSLVASAALAGFAGLVYSWKFATFTSSVGPPLLFPAVAAVFFGASQLRGRPNVWGTIIAVYTLAFGIKGIGLRYPREIDWMQPLFEGLTLIIAVGIASRQGIIKVKRRDRGDRPPPVDSASRPAGEPAPT